MILLQQFIKLLNYTKWDVTDFSSPDQCFDLVVGWCDNLNIPRVFTHLYAYQIYTVWNDEKAKYFTRIENTPDAIPPEGAIIVWKKEYNGFAGHTAIATGKGDLNTFEAFSQNDPVGSPCILKTYNYDYVDGWLVPIVYSNISTDPSTSIPESTSDIKTESEKKAIEYWDNILRALKDAKLIVSPAREDNTDKSVIKAITDALKDKETELQASLREQAQDFNIQKKEVEKQLKEALKQVDKQKDALLAISDDLKIEKDKNSTLEIKVINAQKQLDSMSSNSELEEKIKKLESDVEELTTDLSHYDTPLFRFVDMILSIINSIKTKWERGKT